MATTGNGKTGGSADKLFGTVRETEESTLSAVRRFVETVNDAVPGDGDDGPRARIIDAAFKMTQDLVGASTQLAENIVKAARSEPAKPVHSARKPS